MPNYLSDNRPDFTPFEIDCGKIPGFQYRGDLKHEVDHGLEKEEIPRLLENMLMVREVEEMIIKLRSGAYEATADFEYRGPTHVSIGQEGTAVGACTALAPTDKITSTHRGHGDSMAKGTAAIFAMDEDELRARVPDAKGSSREELLEAALEDHAYRTIGELFGKDDGYCKGRGGGMHIADFSIGHLGANAIVGGGVPIATGAAMALRYLRDEEVVCCFAGDGAYANGVVLEALNWAAQYQFTNKLSKADRKGLPIIFVVQNNHYGMTHRTDNEVMGVETLARRGAGFADDNMKAETVNGMDILAVRDAVGRAAETCRKGEGPVLLEVSTYRYYGHSLSDPRNEYRTREEEQAWRDIDPIDTFIAQVLEQKLMSEDEVEALRKKVADRNARAAVRAAESADPDPADVLKYLYTDTVCDEVPDEHAKVEIVNEPPEIKRDDDQRTTYRDAIKEALIEEMKRDDRVIVYGEDVADYGGAFKATKGLLETFGRDRVFNTPISEACICGTAVGAAMAGLRPVAELMYMDFSLMASDQIANQAAKWHYMSGAQTEVPLVYRASVGGGKGYGGQHSQTLESVFAHIPGLYVVYPATPYDAKGLLKSAIRDNNPVMFVESQILYGKKGVVPPEDYTLPLGRSDVKREGGDLTLVTWGPMLHDVLKAADTLSGEGVEADVIDLLSLVPLDLQPVLDSVRKTGRCVVASHAVSVGSFTAEVASRITHEAFDYLDAPVMRVGARDGIAPQSHVLEAAFLPDADDILSAAKGIL
ncbi:alpha-ketoacid dehydrogenase subunit alpha/beta [Kiritimatiella glycovorans]|uniref:Pyruvate dehydrogenase E1 component, beta subunit n=1 Tax=Kiritimatiella glycovorans TaxID=1307763 RepID=A0A0G3EEC5_9BACT|nr:dehydrogenase E1 component subunit alpha/beta [Kiritimatiella glycovorans]AKJ64678.1 Pyruvate dehydrogenase E1 component, beta subunit [Kiritimatiella glycovorans]